MMVKEEKGKVRQQFGVVKRQVEKVGAGTLGLGRNGFSKTQPKRVVFNFDQGN
jgi:hypothetical protein